MVWGKEEIYGEVVAAGAGVAVLVVEGATAGHAGGVRGLGGGGRERCLLPLLGGVDVTLSDASRDSRGKGEGGEEGYDGEI